WFWEGGGWVGEGSPPGARSWRRSKMRPPGVCPAGPSFFAKRFCRRRWIAGSSPAMTRAVADFPIEIASRKSPRSPRAALLPPKSLMLPRKPARGDADDLLRVGDGGADHLRHAAVRFEE